jgi:beta-galactosidase
MRHIGWGNRDYTTSVWTETLEVADGVDVMARFADGAPALVGCDSNFYLAAWPSRELAADIAQHVLALAGVDSVLLNDDMRIRRRGRITFAFNYGKESLEVPGKVTGDCVLGAQLVGAHNLSAWKN